MIVPDITFEELNARWQYFLDFSKLPYDIIERHDMEFESGTVANLVQDKFYLVGSAAGLIDGLIGSGMPASIMSGIRAAQGIVLGKDYQKEMKTHISETLRRNKIREVVNTFDNDSFDKVISCLKIKPLEYLLYKTHLQVTPVGDFLSRLYLFKS